MAEELSKVSKVSKMRVSWVERKTNEWVLENTKPEWTLESRVDALDMTVREERGMENDVMLGRDEWKEQARTANNKMTAQ